MREGFLLRSPERVPLYEAEWTALGTRCRVALCDTPPGELIPAVIQQVAEFEARFSSFLPDSELSRFNASAGRWAPVSEEMERMLDLCGVLVALSGGAFDPTVLPLLRLWDWRRAQIPSPEELAATRSLVGWHHLERRPGEARLASPGMALDFGGIGKEVAVDRALGRCRGRGVTNALVDFGHDLAVSGHPPGDRAWRLGIADPRQPERSVASLHLRDCGIASSGDGGRFFERSGRRYSHIVSPLSGEPVLTDVRLATVVARTCAEAGALSTTVVLLGSARGLELIRATPGASACLLTDSGLVSEGLLAG